MSYENETWVLNAKIIHKVQCTFKSLKDWKQNIIYEKYDKGSYINYPCERMWR